MKNLQNDLIICAVTSIILLLPFIFMELVNSQGLQGSFPIALFALLWLLQTTFLFLLLPLIKSLWMRKRLQLKFTALLFRFPIMIFIAWIWISILVDQIPCFMGVVNCD